MVWECPKMKKKNKKKPLSSNVICGNWGLYKEYKNLVFFPTNKGLEQGCACMGITKYVPALRGALELIVSVTFLGQLLDKIEEK